MRRPGLDGDHFDLLPFIAILMCTLGCLLLVTMSMAALSIGPAAGEGWIPTRDPGQPVKVPILVEWDGATAVFHLDGRRLGVRWVRGLTVQFEGGRLVTSSPEGRDKEAREVFERALEEVVSRSDTHYALFAVRPSGFATFAALAGEFRRRKVTVGYEPIAQDRPVRLLTRATP